MKKLLPVFALLLLTLGCEGPTGPKGKDGNANVHTRFYTATSTDWDLSGSSYTIQLTNTDITQSIVDNGAVLVYMKTANTSWELLPVTLYISSSSILIFSAVYDLNTVAIFATNNSGAALSPNFTINFKFVTIASLGKNSADVNWKDYNEVKQKFNLQD